MSLEATDSATYTIAITKLSGGMAEATTQQSGHQSVPVADHLGSEPLKSRKTFPAYPPMNPDFSFPSLSSECVDVEREVEAPTNTRTKPRPQDIAITPPPVFMFPPPSTPFASGSGEDLSPQTNRSPSTRSYGHKRCGSEFIGGDGSAAGPGLMSSSPAKPEQALPSPPTTGRRKGHAHRRSGAISTHDISLILNPNKETPLLAKRSFGSAPATPVINQDQVPFLSSVDRSVSQPVIPSSFEYDLPADRRPSTSQARPRVGFSDKVEIIPRPLSTISCETESSLSTIRPSHSANGSISSILSLETANMYEMSLPASLEVLRPSTADSTPVFLPSDDPFGPLPHVRRPMSSSGAAMLIKRGDSFHRLRSGILEEELSPKSHRPRRPTTPHSKSAPQLRTHFQRMRGIEDDKDSVEGQPTQPSPRSEIGKRQRRIKSWAGLLSRKPRSKDSDYDQPNVQDVPDEAPEIAPVKVFSLEDVDFDDDTSCVIRTPGYDSTRSPRFSTPSATEVQKFSSLEDSVNHAEILDLDATWDAVRVRKEAPQLPLLKKRMHSAVASSTVSGLVPYYHRRTESAPSLSPTATPNLDGRWLGKGSQMEDVFEEEDEDEDMDVPTKVLRPKASSLSLLRNNDVTTGLGVRSVDLNIVTKTQFASNTTESKPETEHSHESAVHIADAADEPRFSMITKSSDESTITPQTSQEPLRPSTFPAPLNFAPPSSSMPLFMASPVPSPDPTIGSFDVPRLNTATSSITDHTSWSGSRAYETNTSMSYSTEDVPSLTDSVSTMTTNHLSQYYGPTMDSPLAEQAPVFLATVPRMRRPMSASGKRSSLASLSRLVHSSHGEKSKLSIASSAPPEEVRDTEKKKGNRLSRLMRFWKSKEKLNG